MGFNQTIQSGFRITNKNLKPSLGPKIGHYFMGTFPITQGSVSEKEALQQFIKPHRCTQSIKWQLR